MGIRSLLLLLKPRRAVLNIALVTLVLIALAPPSNATTGTAQQKKNAQATPSLHQNLDDIPLTPQELEEKKREAARAVVVKQMRTKALAEVESAAKSVTSPDTAALAKALRVEARAAADPEFETAAQSAIRLLGDLDGDGTPEAAFRWSRVERFNRPMDDEMGRLPGWVLFLLSWDGARWRVSELMTGDGVCGLDSLPGIWPTEGIVVVEGLSSVPYPVVFRFQDHAATVAWDSRDGESRYQGYARGSVEFQEREAAPPAMIVSGRADPGVIRFSPNGSRGFEAATVYFWENGAYVPRRTEFEENEDYMLYRFIAALHLRDFRTAHSLIEAAQFIKGSEKTPEGLRKQVEENWPEFVGNTIFEAIEGHAAEGNQLGFEWHRGDAHYTYSPAFSNDGKRLLTGLERRQVK